MNRAVFWTILALAATWGWARADGSLEERSEAIRTALHYDAALPGRVEELCQLYAAEGRQAELAGLYESHVAAYPGDRGAACVLLRIYQCSGAGKAEPWAREVAARFSGDAYALSLAFESLGDPALLVASIRLETQPARRIERMKRLLEAPEAPGDRAATGKILGEIAPGLAPEDGDWRALAGAALASGYAAEVAAWLRSWEVRMPAGEDAVARELLLARAEEALGDKAAAERRLRGLLARLDAGAAEREAILGTLFRMLQSLGREEEEAERLRRDVAGRPDDAALVGDLAVWLLRMGRNEEATEVVRQGSLRLPHAGVLEAKALELLRGAELLGFLREKLDGKGQGNRADLRARLARALFAQGLADEAWGEWGKAEALLPAGERQKERLRLARELGSEGQPETAARLLESAVRDEPGQIEARWDLAGLRDKLGDRTGSRAALIGARLDGLPAEAVPAHADRLMDAELWEEAERWLSEARERWGEVPELTSRRLRLLAAMGGRSEGERILGEMRGGAVTPEAYRVWLKGALAFHGEDGTGTAFLQGEKNRLRDGDWTIKTVERFLILCEMAKEEGARDEVIGWLRAWLDAGPGKPGEEGVRRMLIAALGADEAHALEVEAQRKWLLARPEVAREEDRVGLAGVYARGNRPDLARAHLAAARVDQLMEPEALEAGARMGSEMGERALAEAMLRRWTEMAPASGEAWGARLGFLQAQGMEEAFRQAVEACEKADLERQEELAPDRLRRQWEESALRSLLRWFGEGRREDARLLLTDCRRRAKGAGADWIRWMEGLGSGECPWKSPAVPPRWIEFPGDWRLNGAEAETALRWAAESGEGSSAEPWPFPDTPRLRWIFEAGKAGVAVAGPAAENTLLILDERGALRGVDLVTGKLRWQRELENDRGAEGLEPETLNREGGVPLLLRSGNRLLKVQRDGSLVLAPADGSGGAERACPGMAVLGDVAVVADGAELAGFGAEDGKLRWRMRLSSPAERARRRPWDGGRECVLLGSSAGGVAAFDPVTGVLASVDGATGKLRWIAEEGSDFREAAFEGEAVVLRARGRLRIRNGRNGEVVWEGRSGGPEGGGLRLAGGVACLGDGAAWEMRPVRLPLRASRVEAEGALLGGARGAVVFWGAGGIQVVDVLGGMTRRVPAGEGPLVAAFLAGGRIVTVKEAGYAVWSLPGARRLQEGPWPGDAGKWLGLEGTVEWRNGAMVSRTWTGLGPVERPAATWGGVAPGGWWMALDSGRVACWDRAE